MRKRLGVTVLGVVLVGVALAGLLGVLDSLARTEPLEIKGNNNANGQILDSGSNQNSNSEFKPGRDNTEVPFDLSSDIDLASSVLSPEIVAEGDPLPHIPLFEVVGAASTALLRSTVTSSLENGVWRFNPDTPQFPYNGEVLPLDIENFSRKLAEKIQVSPLAQFPEGQVALPAAQYVESLLSEMPVNYLPEDHLFYSPEGMPDFYSFEAVNFDFDESTLNNASLDMDPQYLQVPETTTERTKQLAEEIIQGISSPYEQAKAIEDYLKENYTYDFDYEKAPAGQDPNDWFLFEEQKGVCSNFNSAFVALARSVGIPARLVGGFAIKPQAETQEVFADQAHAWAEVKFDHLGWLTFDATGSGPQPIDTVTEITEVETTVLKGHSFSVKGTVTAADNVQVDGVLVEILINPKKSQTGGTPIGKGLVKNGYFDIESTVPGESNIGNYQLLAHTLDSARFNGSWSDPRIKVASGTRIDLHMAGEVKQSEPVTIQGFLSEDSERAIQQQEIDLLLNGQKVAQVFTGEDGQFRWTTTFARAGEFTLKASFDATDYYLKSEKEVTFMVLVPTVIDLRAADQARTGETVLISGYLREEATQKPVAGREILLSIDGAEPTDSAITDSSGRFEFTCNFEESGIHQVKTIFLSAPYYWESSSGAVLQINPAGGGNWWLVPLIVLIAAAAAVGGFIWYRRKAVNRTNVEENIVEDAPVEETGIDPAVEQVDSKYKLDIEFPQISEPFPDVWGKGESLEVLCRLSNAEGLPMNEAVIQVSIDDQEAQIKTTSSGAARLRLTFPEKGESFLEATYQDENETAQTSRTIRIVDYREEIVSLYRELLVWFRSKGIDLPEDATPRENQDLILKDESGISSEALNRVITCFEEANYSLHPVNRSKYEEMYLAQKEVREHEQQSGEN